MLEQTMLIQAVKENGKVDKRIEAIWMYGSFAQGGGDAYSDVEFYIFVQDDALATLDTEDWIGRVHPLYAHFFNEFGTQVVIFKNMVRGEFHFHAASEMPMIEEFRDSLHMPDLDAMCLVDKSGALHLHLQPLKDAAFAASDEKAQFAVDNMLNNLLFGWSMFRRGEMARSHEMLWYVQRYYLQLICISQSRMAHWLNATRYLEQEIPAEFYAAYSKCTASLCRQSLQNAYAAALGNLKEMLPQLKAQGFSLKNYGELLEKLEAFMTEILL